MYLSMHKHLGTMNPSRVEASLRPESAPLAWAWTLGQRKSTLSGDAKKPTEACGPNRLGRGLDWSSPGWYNVPLPSRERGVKGLKDSSEPLREVPSRLFPASPPGGTSPARSSAPGGQIPSVFLALHLPIWHGEALDGYWLE